MASLSAWNLQFILKLRGFIQIQMIYFLECSGSFWKMHYHHGFYIAQSHLTSQLLTGRKIDATNQRRGIIHPELVNVVYGRRLRAYKKKIFGNVIQRESDYTFPEAVMKNCSLSPLALNVDE